MFFVLAKVGGFLATPSNLLGIVAALGILAALAGWPAGPWALRLAALAVAGLLLLGLGPFATWFAAPLENRFPPFRDDGRPVAGIVVLGGAVLPRTSFARDQLVVGDAAERVIAMADLGRRYPEARIVFSGGSGAVLSGSPPEADAVSRFAGTLGIDPARITFENRSRTTFENAVESRKLVSPQAGERWLLVTSAWHMPRAVGSFRSAGFPVVAYPVDYLTGDGGEAGAFKGSVAAGLDRLDTVSREWLGLLAYRVSGRTGSLLPSP